MQSVVSLQMFPLTWTEQICKYVSLLSWSPSSPSLPQKTPHCWWLGEPVEQYVTQWCVHRILYVEETGFCPIPPFLGQSPPFKIQKILFWKLFSRSSTTPFQEAQGAGGGIQERSTVQSSYIHRSWEQLWSYATNNHSFNSAYLIFNMAPSMGT